MKKWNSYKSSQADEKFDVIIIGSDISGLTVGALLSLNGKRVLILEKHFKIGGFTHTFRSDNYEWDVGIHYVGEVHKPWSMIRKLFDLISGNELTWSQMDENYDRMIFPDRNYDFIAPNEKFIESMISSFPMDELGIFKYITLVNNSVKSAKSFFLNKALPDPIGFLSYPFMAKNFFNYSDRITYDVLNEIINDKN